MEINDIFRPDAVHDEAIRLLATWDALPLAVLICGFFVISSSGAWAFTNWWLKPRRDLIVKIFCFEAALASLLFLVLGGVFAIENYGLLPRSTMSRCELNSIRMRLITGALDNHYRKQGAFPVVKDWSAALTVSGIWPSEVIPQDLLLDAGGAEFRLNTDGFTAALRSGGSDRVFDTTDDYLCEKNPQADVAVSSAATWTCFPDGLSIKSGNCSW